MKLKYLTSRPHGEATADSTDDFVSLDSVESWTGRRVPAEAGNDRDMTGLPCVPGDVVFGKLRPYLAKIYRIDRASVCASEFIPMRPKATVESKYLYYSLSTERFVSLVNSLSYGSKMPRVSPTTFLDLKLIVPSRPEQRAVSDYLDIETDRIDSLIDRKQRFIDLLMEKRTAVITHAVTKGLDPNAVMKDSGIDWLGSIPSHWEVGTVRRWWRVIDCKHRTVVPALEGTPMVSIGQLQNVRTDCSEARLASREDYLDLIDGGRDPRPNDVVYSRNASVGLVSVVEAGGPVCLGQDVCMLRSLTGRDSGLYLTYELRSAVGAEQLRALQRGPTFNRINVGNIRDFFLCRPPADEQVRIAAFIEQETASIDALVDRTRTSIELLKEYRNALISAAVTGQIEIAD